MPLLATREQRTKEQNKEINCTCPVSTFTAVLHVQVVFLHDKQNTVQYINIKYMV